MLFNGALIGGELENMALQTRWILMVTSMFHFINDATIMILPAISPVLFKEFHFSYFDAGLLYGVTLLVMVVFQIVFGTISYRFNELDLIAIGNSLIVLSCLLMALISSSLALARAWF